MPIQHTHTMLCERVLTDLTGKVSLINTFWNIEMPGFPARMPLMYLVVVLQGDPGEAYEVLVEPPGGGDPLFRFPQVIPEPDTDPRPGEVVLLRTIAELTGTRFDEPGTYHVTLRSGDQVLDRCPFGVLQHERGEGINHANADDAEA